MTKASDELGRWGEDLAQAKLREDGMQILDTRWRTRDGEIDIVARDGRTIVFCEVKSRSGVGFGGPFEAVTAVKQRRLRKLAGAWLADHNGHAEDLRFDVVGVLRTASGTSIEHIRAAF